jgi:glycosyltransferase involved in cell wall biosynthesis
MPYDFDKQSIEFIKYSMPTKASEYMVSGVPILLYCHKEVTLFDHAKKYGWASIVSDNNIEVLSNAINEIIFNNELRWKISNAARDYAIENYDSIKVRANFKKTFFLKNKK